MISTLDDLRIWATALATGTLLSPATQTRRLNTNFHESRERANS
jgi:D-alanyl-D-alanine carboxypeptidase